MTALMISLFCVLILEPIFNAVSDTLENEPNFNKSIFASKNKYFWLKSESWRRPFIPFTKYRPDGWHISKSLQIVSFAVGYVLLFINVKGECFFTLKAFLLLLIVYGVIRNGVFNLFYNKILRKRK